jgi:hypothetical protein
MPDAEPKEQNPRHKQTRFIYRPSSSFLATASVLALSM